jgi:hypothetical protein
LNVWKVVGQIAAGFGVIFIVFAAFSAFITYEAISLQGGMLPPGYLQVNLLNAMLPYLLYAVLSFVVSGLIIRAIREPVMTEEAVPDEKVEQTELQTEETS